MQKFAVPKTVIPGVQMEQEGISKVKWIMPEPTSYVEHTRKTKHGVAKVMVPVYYGMSASLAQSIRNTIRRRAMGRWSN